VLGAQQLLMGGGAGFRGYWDAHEEELLRRGVQRHGIGSWERIRHDVEFRLLKCAARLAGSLSCSASRSSSPLRQPRSALTSARALQRPHRSAAER